MSENRQIYIFEMQIFMRLIDGTAKVPANNIETSFGSDCKVPDVFRVRFLNWKLHCWCESGIDLLKIYARSKNC